MKLSELKDNLNSISGFQGKVAYRAFPENKAPDLPFICYLENGSNNFSADNISYLKRKVVDIELYSKNKDISSEEVIEEKLDEMKLPFEKDETYIESEKCYEVIYTVEV